MSNDNDEETLSHWDAGFCLGVHVGHVKQMVRDGRLREVQTANGPAVRARDVDEVLEQQRAAKQRRADEQRAKDGNTTFGLPSWMKK